MGLDVRQSEKENKNLNSEGQNEEEEFSESTEEV